MSSNHVLTVLHNERAALAARVAELEQEGRDTKRRIREVDEALVLLSKPADQETASFGTQTGLAALTEGLTLRELVLEIVKIGDGVKPIDIQERLEAVGRVTPSNSILSTLSRLKLTERSIFKAGNGKWYPTANGGSAVMNNNVVSGGEIAAIAVGSNRALQLDVNLAESGLEDIFSVSPKEDTEPLVDVGNGVMKTEKQIDADFIDMLGSNENGPSQGTAQKPEEVAEVESDDFF